MADNDLLQAALSYAARGWPVFPLRPRGKEPLTDHGFKDATTDPMVLLDWWQRWPDANIGIATGAPSGLLVVDVDPRHGGDDSLHDLERQHGPLPETVESLTGGGGQHIFFGCPDGVGCGKLAEGVDIKGNGGYIVAPPSVHPSGKSYEWEVLHHPDDVALADPPAWLLALLATPKATAAAPDPTSDRIPTGQRNTVLTSLAGSMRRKGATESAIEAALLAENAQCCDPPLPEADVKRIAASVSRYDPVAVSDELLTDLGNCQRFVSQHGDDLRYCHGVGWLAWDGRRWARDEDGAAAMRCAKQTALRLYDEAKAELQRAIDSLTLAQAAAAAGGSAAKTALEQMQNAYKTACRRLMWAEKSQSRQRLEGMVALAQSEDALRVHVDDLDRDPWLLNVQNGTLDLRTGTLREHRREDLLTQVAAVDFDPTARGERWRRHLETFLPPDVRRQVQRDLGLSLVGADLEEILPIWYGTGGNGKSTTLRVLQTILGDYAQMAAPKLLMESKYERHPTELAELRGKRLIFSVETKEGGRLDEERVKLLSGGERIRGRFMRQDFIEFASTWVITLVTNHKPTIRGADGGIWRRIRFVPWTVALPKEKQRPQEEVVTELLAEGPAILGWLVEGLRDWQRDHHWMADAVRAATDAYRAEQDVLGGFLADCCEIGPRYAVPAATLFDRYTQWCEENSEEPVKKDTFRRMLIARGFAKIREGHAMTPTWRGIRLQPLATSDSVSPEKSKTNSPIGTYTEKVVASGCSDSDTPAADDPTPTVRIEPRRVVVDKNRLQELLDAGIPREEAVDLAAIEEPPDQGPPSAEDCVICGLPTLLRDPHGWPLCSRCAERAAEGMIT